MWNMTSTQEIVAGLKHSLNAKILALKNGQALLRAHATLLSGRSHAPALRKSVSVWTRDKGYNLKHEANYKHSCRGCRLAKSFELWCWSMIECWWGLKQQCNSTVWHTVRSCITESEKQWEHKHQRQMTDFGVDAEVQTLKQLFPKFWCWCMAGRYWALKQRRSFSV